MAGEMITEILRIIETVMISIQPCFVRRRNFSSSMTDRRPLFIDSEFRFFANADSSSSLASQTSLLRDFDFDCEICESKSYRITSPWDKIPRLGGELS